MEGASVVVAASRPRLLVRLLGSLAAASPGPQETLVVLNGPDPALREACAPWEARLRGLRLVGVSARSPASARNAALPLARGEWLVFLDDDVTVPPGYFAELSAAAAEHPEADVIGGPNLTPDSSTAFQRCVGLALESPFGAGPMRRRYRGGPSDAWCGDEALILCNLALRARALRQAGLEFPGELSRNEENLLLAELTRRGARALHRPRLEVYHERREGPAAFFRQCYLSGLGRGQMSRRLPLSLRPVHLGPLLALAAPPALLLAAGAPAASGALGLYAAASLANAAWMAAGRGGRGRGDAARVAWLVPVAHAGYALGLAAGLLGRPR